MLLIPPTAAPPPSPSSGPPALNLGWSTRRPALQLAGVVLLVALVAPLLQPLPWSPLKPAVLIGIPFAIGLAANGGFARIAMAVMLVLAAFATMTALVWLFGWAP